MNTALTFIAVQFAEQKFAECQNVTLLTQPLSGHDSVHGVPPYYLIAFEAGGVPTTTLLEGDPANLAWQVRHKRGKLYLKNRDENLT